MIQAGQARSLLPAAKAAEAGTLAIGPSQFGILTLRLLQPQCGLAGSLSNSPEDVTSWLEQMLFVYISSSCLLRL